MNSDFNSLMASFLNVMENEMNDLQRGKYIIGSVTVHGISFAPKPKVHSTMPEAQAEAERLARTNPGKEFFVARIEGRVVASGVRWN